MEGRLDLTEGPLEDPLDPREDLSEDPEGPRSSEYFLWEGLRFDLPDL